MAFLEVIQILKMKKKDEIIDLCILVKKLAVLVGKCILKKVIENF